MKRITHGLIALTLSGAFALSAGVLVSDRSGATPTADDGWIVAGVAAADGWIIINGADVDPPIVVQGGG